MTQNINKRAANFSSKKNYPNILSKHFGYSPEYKHNINKATLGLNLSSLCSLCDDLEKFDLTKDSFIKEHFTFVKYLITQKIIDFEEQMEKINPDEFEIKYKEDIKKFLSGKIKTIKKGCVMYRARSSCHNIPSPEMLSTKEFFKYPYFERDISNPPNSFSVACRFNKDKYSYLYLASSIKTALTEIKPEAKEIISLGKFKAQQELKLLDLSRNKTFEDIVLRSSKENWKVYYFSQFISDIARELHFDGIWYRSVQTSGENAVIFNPKKFSFVKNSEKIFRINLINVKFEELKDEKKNTTLFLKVNTRSHNITNDKINYDPKVLEYIESNNIDPDVILGLETEV